MCALVRNDRLDTADDRSISIYLTIVPAATPCVPLQRGRSLIDGAGSRPINRNMSNTNYHRRAGVSLCSRRQRNITNLHHSKANSCNVAGCFLCSCGAETAGASPRPTVSYGTATIRQTAVWLYFNSIGGIDYTSCFLFPASCFPLPTFLLPASCFLLPASCLLFPFSRFPLPVSCFLLSPFNNLIINFSPTVQKAAVAGGRQPLWLLCKTFSETFSACVRLPVCLGASQISNVHRCRSGFLCTSVKVRLSVYLVAGRASCIPL